MHLDNVVIDSTDHRRAAQFWSGLLGLPVGWESDDEAGVQLTFGPGPGGETHGATSAPPGYLDLCFVPVPEPIAPLGRLHLDVAGGAPVVSRARQLGATPLDIGQGDAPWSVLADTEGHAFCVLDESVPADRPAYAARRPVTALPLEVAPGRLDTAFAWWEWATRWQEVSVPGAVRALSHPSGDGPLLELCVEDGPKLRKNQIHLDLRVVPGEDRAARVEEAVARGATVLDHHWGELPWVVLADPSGNEVCLLG